MHARTCTTPPRWRSSRAAWSGCCGRNPRNFDALILDPPRAGAGKAVVKQLIDAGPRAVAYVSCDPASFARDLRLLPAGRLGLAGLRAFDLYPHTHHMETVALLTPQP